jgi:imidazole glycerol phosphate synthase glutamine amidotransferase subunit
VRSAVVVDYGAGNIGSISNFLRNFEFTVEVTNDSAKIVGAELLVLPGVGSFGPAKSNLDLAGASTAILERSAQARPILGICLGFQLMTLSSEESEGARGFGLMNARTKRLSEGPIIGWQNSSPRGDALELPDSYYFNHAYGVFGLEELEDTSVAGKDSYIAFARIGNLIGTQFHPEKSQQAGLDFFSLLLNSFWPEIV